MFLDLTMAWHRLRDANPIYKSTIQLGSSLAPVMLRYVLPFSAPMTMEEMDSGWYAICTSWGIMQRKCVRSSA
jgi:hypothetical protein